MYLTPLALCPELGESLLQGSRAGYLLLVQLRLPDTHTHMHVDNILVGILRKRYCTKCTVNKKIKAFENYKYILYNVILRSLKVTPQF